jgi:hypothetical protein
MSESRSRKGKKRMYYKKRVLTNVFSPAYCKVTRFVPRRSKERRSGEGSEMGMALIEVERSRSEERKESFKNIGLPLSQPFLEGYVKRLPKNYRLTKEGERIMEETGAQLIFNQSPAGATRSKRKEIKEIAKRYAAVGATFEDDPSKYLVLRKGKRRQLW